MQDTTFVNPQTFCARPYTTRVITPSGFARPCCHFHSIHSYSEADFNQLKQDLNGGLYRKECTQCWQKEAASLDYTLRDRNRNQELEIRFLELNLSNICNMKCRMCGPDSSSLWIAEHRHLLDNTPAKHFREGQKEALQNSFESDQDMIRYFETLNLTKIEKLKIAGGEPFLQKSLPVALQYLIQKNIVDIEVTVISNGSTLPAEYLELLKKFKYVDFQLSIEATGKLYQYIRGGAKYPFEMINQNLQKVKASNFNLSVNAAFSAYSAYGIADVFIWIHQNIKNIERDFHSYPVFRPNYLSPQVLPLYFRQRALEHNLDKLEKANLLKEFPDYTVGRLLQYKLPYEQKLFENFLVFTRETDLYRNESFADCMPDSELRAILNDHSLAKHFE